jgi:hypothetical protein
MPPTLNSTKRTAVKNLITLVLLLGALVAGSSRADTSPDFVRVACVPENGLLDVESRTLHDSVAGRPAAETSGVATALAGAGFHRPRGLRLTCDLDGALYVITAEQGETSNYMCGGSPDVHLTVTRDGAALFSDVVFGASCSMRPSVMRFTIGDGAKSWRGRETMVCYAIGTGEDPEHCEWTFGTPADFNKRFPVDQNAVDRIGSRKSPRP